jgi:hypothetical protein
MRPAGTASGVILGITASFFVATAVVGRAAQPPGQEKGKLTGDWTLNRELSDQPPSRDAQGRGRGEHGGYGHGGGTGRGGYGGGMHGGYGGGQGGGRANMDPEEMARMRDAIRDVVAPPDHLNIVQTDSMIVLTAPDGRTTRLSPDGKKVKDDNTKIERKTKWDGGTLLSEISGAGSGKVTQTFAVDSDARQLHLTVQMEGGRNNQARTIKYVYDVSPQ